MFGDERAVAAVTRWRMPGNLQRSLAVRDTLDSPKLAAKRWRYYRRSIATVTTVRDFRAAVRKDAQAEVCFMLVVRAKWFPSASPIALAQCRRTYCNHVILEFLSVHPRIVGKVEPSVRGVGAGLLCALAELSARFNAKTFGGRPRRIPRRSTPKSWAATD
jgi:hypothetical protein